MSRNYKFLSRCKIKKITNIEFFKTHKVKFVLGLFFLFFLFSNIFLTSSLQSFTNPIYGGDYYYQLGCVNHVKFGGDVFSNCNLDSSNSNYMPVYSFLVGNFAKVFDLSGMSAMFIFSSLLVVLNFLLMFFMFRSFNLSNFTSLFGSILITTVSPILKYTEFSRFIIVPILIIILKRFYDNQNYLNSVLLGIIVGVSSISHSVLLPASYLFLGTIFILLSFDKSFKKFYLKLFELKYFILVSFFIVVIISSFYWFSPIFEFGLKTSENFFMWNGVGDLSKFSLQIFMFMEIIKAVFFNVTNIFGALKSILFISSICYICYKIYSKKVFDKIEKFSLFYLVVSFLLIFSYFVTVPLFNISFLPDYLFLMVGHIFILIVSLIYFDKIYSNLSLKYKVKDCLNLIIKSFLILILLSIYFSTVLSVTNDFWYGVGKNSISSDKTELAEFIINNSEVNDVILTTKNIGFVLNSLTGRKLVTSKRAQGDPFENMDVRDLDQAIILYSDNQDLRKELIKKYNIKYFYWNVNWKTSEFNFKDNKIVSKNEPLLAFDSVEKRKYLDENEIKYFVYNDYVDSFLQGENHPKFDLIVVSPENYYKNSSFIWNSKFNELLNPVWSYKDRNGQELAILFEVIIK